jgi:hypothetical protein
MQLKFAKEPMKSIGRCTTTASVRFIEYPRKKSPQALKSKATSNQGKRKRLAVNSADLFQIAL